MIVQDKPRRILNVAFGLGHNNDQGLMKLTELEAFMEKYNLKFLGDGGYHHYRIVTPESVPAELEQLQKDERSVVEIIIGLVKGFEVAAGTFRQSPELQQFTLAVVYELTQLKLLDETVLHNLILNI